jgi:hypothetical protein
MWTTSGPSTLSPSTDGPVVACDGTRIAVSVSYTCDEGEAGPSLEAHPGWESGHIHYRDYSLQQNFNKTKSVYTILDSSR